MVDAFATVDDLAARLNRTFSVEEEPWITTLLEDASTYLRDIIGWQVFPQETVTFAAWPDGSREVVLPQQPVISVDAVEVDSVAVPYEERDGVVTLEADDRVDITFTFGFAVSPDSLKRWACVLVSQALLPLELNLGLTVGGLSSVALDDFKAAFADAGELSGIALSDRNIELLRSQYRGGVEVGGSR